MSLTRAQWVEMWASVKLIETHAKSLYKDGGLVQHIGGPAIRRRVKPILEEIPKMKNAIESVIGQMEPFYEGQEGNKETPKK